jgi:hypothetical protein
MPVLHLENLLLWQVAAVRFEVKQHVAAKDFSIVCVCKCNRDACLHFFRFVIKTFHFAGEIKISQSGPS